MQVTVLYKESNIGLRGITMSYRPIYVDSWFCVILYSDYVCGKV